MVRVRLVWAPPYTQPTHPPGPFQECSAHPQERHLTGLLTTPSPDDCCCCFFDAFWCFSWRKGEGRVIKVIVRDTDRTYRKRLIFQCLLWYLQYYVLLTIDNVSVGLFAGLDTSLAEGLLWPEVLCDGFTLACGCDTCIKMIPRFIYSLYSLPNVIVVMFSI